MSLNRIVLIGRITKEVEKQVTQRGVSVRNTTIAVDRDYKQGNEKVTDFIDLVLWRHNADYIEKYAGKGAQIAVEGKMQSRKWQDKEGNNRTSWEVQVDNVQIVNSKRDGAAPAGQNYPAPSGGGFSEPEDFGGELPF
jgi:single-strand DNA-binding protein